MDSWWTTTKQYLTGIAYCAALVASVIEFTVTDLYYQKNQRYKTIIYHQIGFVTRFSASLVIGIAFLMWHKPSISDIIAVLILFGSSCLQLFFVCKAFNSCDFTKWRGNFAKSSTNKLLRWNEFSQTLVLILCIIAALMGSKDTLIRLKNKWF